MVTAWVREFIGFLLLLVAVPIIFSSTDVAAQESPLTNTGIETLVKSGLSTDVIKAKIAASPCTFDTSVEGLKELREAGVPQEVILAMVEAKCGAVLHNDAAAIPTTTVPSLLPPTPDAIKKQATTQRDACHCPIATLVMFLPDGTPMLAGSTNNQRKWMEKHQADLVKKHQPFHFYWTPDWEDADYIVIWWEGTQRYAYTSVFPVTTNMYGDVNETATTYAPTTQFANAVTANMRVYKHDGALVFYSWKTATLRWQKPDVDVLKQTIAWFDNSGH